MVTKTISHYRLSEKLGEGGMGVVYKAEDTRLKRPAALKFLSQVLTHDPEAKERFIREAQSAGALDHPNICTIYEIDEWEGQTFMAMAFIDGRSLKQRVAEGPLAVHEAVDIASQVAAGLRAAHEKNIIHRDIKPGNIMLTQKGQAKILDFGLARLEWGGDLTRTAAVMGTAAYMSPEQARGDKVDHRTDLWALGCVLYEMLSGRRPFASERDQSVVYSILNEEPQPVSKLRKDIPVGLEQIVQKCLQKGPRERYQDAAALIEALDSFEKSSQKASQPSIAVLPFVDMSSQKDQEYFCDGIAEELINDLTHIKDLRVVARTSAFAFKGKDADVREIGRKLNVDSVLEGSIRKAGTRLRITAQLIKVEDGFHLWSEKFDRELDDIFAIQDEISKAIVDNLKITLLAREKAAIEKHPTDDPEAYNLYLKGLHFTYQPSTEALNRALDYYRSAIERDPNFALAYAGMASVYANFGILSLASPAEMLPKAKTAFGKALELDSDLAEAHFNTAYINFYYEWDWEIAGRSFERALALNPGNALVHALYAWFCVSGKRFEEAVKEIKLAQNLDPLQPLFHTFCLGIYWSAGKYDEAISEFPKAVELDPNSGLAYFHAGVAFSFRREFSKAISAFQKSKELAVYAGWADGWLGFIHISLGENKEAEQILEDMLEQKKKTHVSSVSIGWLWAALGNLDKAFEYFYKAWEERDTLMPFIHIYTKLFDFGAEILKDPRYTALLKRLKLDF